MKKAILIFIPFLLLSACGEKSSSSAFSTSESRPSSSASSSNLLSPEDEALYGDEMKKSFSYFYRSVSSDKASKGFGLVADRFQGTIASTAATGFGLAALAIGAENNYLSKDEASSRAEITLTNLLAIENFHGFYYHFLDFTTGIHEGTSEVSSIDTAILISGALIAGAYFGGSVQEKANTLYANVDWTFFVGNNGTKKQFRMAYYPASESFGGYWDYYAEQLMLYVLGAGAPNEAYRTSQDLYLGFTRAKGSFAGNDFIYSWFGSLFTYQYSQAFIDFRGLYDAQGVNWYQNSIDASTAAYDWCISRKSQFKTYGEGAWGLTACDTRKGYNGYLGNQPRGWNASEGGSDYTSIEGTLAPCGALGSMPFTPEYSLQALRHYESIDSLYGIYGLFDSYDEEVPWSATTYIGIDKGITLVMMDNYRHGTVWQYSKKVSGIQNGLSRLLIKEGRI